MAHAVKKFVPESVPHDIRTEADDITARGAILHPRGGVVSRLGGMATLYFKEGSRPEVRREVLAILAEFLAAYGQTITRYQRRDERRLRTWPAQSVPDAYRDPALQEDPEAPFYISMRGLGEGDSDPCLALFWASLTTQEDEALFRPLSAIRLHVPPQVLLDDPDGFARRLAGWAARLPLVHGTAGLGALSAPGLEDQYAAWWLWLEAYPGLEYDAVGSYWSELRTSIRDREGGPWKPRSSNWLTFLGPQAVATLGAVTAVSAALGPGVAVVQAGPSLMLRAGTRPVLGSAAEGGVPAAYRNVARLIRSIRFTDYRYSVIKYPEPVAPDSAARLARCLAWLRRMDD